MNVPGVNLGMRVGESLGKLFFSGNSGMVIVHRIPGRRRYVCKALKNEKAACLHLEELIQSFPGIMKATVNPMTGSVIVVYDQSEKVIDALFDSMSHALAGKHAVHELTVIPTGILTVGDNINDSLRSLRDNVRGFFNHSEPMFLSRMLGLALFSYGLIRILYRGDRPAGPQLFWWGLGLLLRQSHPDPKKVFAANLEEKNQ